MFTILLTAGSRAKLHKLLEIERQHNSDAVFRIWESCRGRFDDAVFSLRIGIDVVTENDKTTFCAGLPFVASSDFLDLRGEPHTFYIVLDERGIPTVHPLST